MKSLSLKNYGNYEQEKVNTPLSIEACFREGIDPEDLVYYPEQDFSRPNLQKSIQKMNFEFYEKQRIKLLDIAKKQYLSLANKDHKRAKSHKTLKINDLVSSEINKIKHKESKFVSRLVNYKLDNIKNTIGNSNTLQDFKSSKQSFSKPSKKSSTSRDFLSKPGTSTSLFKRNAQKDAQLIQEELKTHHKNIEIEKQKIQDAHKRRKEAESKLEEHLLKVKEMREKETLEKVQRFQNKFEKSEKQIQTLHQKRVENQRNKIEKDQEKISKVVSLKHFYEETVKQERENIIKKENEKIEIHTENKLKNQKEVLSKVKERNMRQEMKSKVTLEKQQEDIEEKKMRTLENFTKVQKKLEKFKEENQKYQEYIKQKNKLREVERNWNIERANRKQDFYRNEKLNDIKNSFYRVKSMEDAKDYLKRFRHDFLTKNEADRLKIEKEIYQMEVKKKFDLEKISNILQTEKERSPK